MSDTSDEVLGFILQVRLFCSMTGTWLFSILIMLVLRSQTHPTASEGGRVWWITIEPVVQVLSPDIWGKHLKSVTSQNMADDLHTAIEHTI